MGEEITVNLKAVVRKKTPETKLSNLFSKYKKVNPEEEEKKTKLDKAEIGRSMKSIVDSIFDPTTGMSEEEKEAFINELHRKIKAGEKLTADEMQYLRINDPIQYAKMAKVQAERQALETRLKHCKSKEEAQEAYVSAMSRVSKEDPTREETIAAYNNVYEEFTKSGDYDKLPNTKKEADELDDGNRTCEIPDGIDFSGFSMDYGKEIYAGN